jgi:hypothetical protein
MYCGNNRLDPRVVNGDLVVGDRYRCFQRGVGKGMTLPPYSGDYDPIHNEKIYCGKKDSLPQGYARFGSNNQCFQKGVGVGKKIPSSRRSASPPPQIFSRHEEVPPLPISSTPNVNIQTWSNDNPNQALLLTFALIVMGLVSSFLTNKEDTIKYALTGPFSIIL